MRGSLAWIAVIVALYALALVAWLAFPALRHWPQVAWTLAVIAIVLTTGLGVAIWLEQRTRPQLHRWPPSWLR